MLLMAQIVLENGNLPFFMPITLKSMLYESFVILLGDISAEQMIFGVEGVDPERRDELLSLLEIDLEWRMHTVSDGQRRRVQICIGLLKPFKVGKCAIVQ